MFRAAIAAQSPLGQQVAPIVASGELVPDELTVGLIRERLSEDDARDGFVLDGFPRNLAQAEELDEMLAGIGRGLDAILFFDLPDDIATERLLGRAADEGRTDDSPEVIARRLEIYHARDRADRRALPRHRQARAAARRRTVDDVYARDQRGARAVRGARRDHPQERRRRSS